MSTGNVTTPPAAEASAEQARAEQVWAEQTAALSAAQQRDPGDPEYWLPWPAAIARRCTHPGAVEGQRCPTCWWYVHTNGWEIHVWEPGCCRSLPGTSSTSGSARAPRCGQGMER